MSKKPSDRIREIFDSKIEKDEQEIFSAWMDSVEQYLDEEWEKNNANRLHVHDFKENEYGEWVCVCGDQKLFRYVTSANDQTS